MSKKSVLESMRVTSPCTENWDEMTGSDKVRFCSHCARDVNDISNMTRKEAVRLVRRSDGRLCIRYISDPKSGAPMFTEQLIQISRRAPRLAAGLMSASLSLSTLAYAQTEVLPTENVPAISVPSDNTKPELADDEAEPKDEVASGGIGGVYGKVIDHAGAVIGGASVRLLDKAGNEIQTITTDDEGIYSIDNIQAAVEYSIEITAPGFTVYSQDIQIAAGGKRRLNATLNIASVAGGMMISVREYERPLAAAVAQEDIEAVRDLIVRGEDVNGKEDDKTTPLFIAVENGNLEIVHMLLDAGAQVNARDESKRTPLMRIDDDATTELMETLFDYGAKVDLTDDDGNTVLILAAGSVPADVIGALIDAGADVNLSNNRGQTALMNAADEDALDTVRRLLEAGAKVNLKNSEDETAIDLTSDDEITLLLIGFGAKVPENIETPQTPDQIDD